MIAAIGGGYIAYSVKQASQAKEIDFSIASREAPSIGDTDEQAHAVVTEEVETVPEVTPYSEWQSQIASVDRLKHQLDALNEAVGMSSTMSGLLVNVEDPLQQILGSHYAVQIKFEKQLTAEIQADQELSALEFEKELDNSMLRIAALQTSVDRMCALLDLGKTYEAINLPGNAELAYQQAEKAALEAMSSGDQAQIVLAEVMAAEHKISNGQQDEGRVHYASAVDAAKLDELNSNWAMAFVVRSEAGAGMFADAYTLVEEIQDNKIQAIAMDDVVRIAEQLEGDSEIFNLAVDESGLDGNLSNEVEFADDAALMLLFENDKKMKENARKISNLLDR